MKKTQVWQLPHPGRIMANEPGNLGITAQLADNSRVARSVFPATHYVLQEACLV